MLFSDTHRSAGQIALSVLCVFVALAAFAFNPKLRGEPGQKKMVQQPVENSIKVPKVFVKDEKRKPVDVKNEIKKPQIDSDPFTLNTIVNNTPGVLNMGGSDPEDVPERIADRPDETQYVFNTGTPAREAVEPEYSFPKMVVYPSRKFNELVIGANFKENGVYDPNWRLEASFYNSHKQLVRQTKLAREKIGDLMVVRITFDQLPKDNYLLNVRSTDGIIKETYRIHKDF